MNKETTIITIDINGALFTIDTQATAVGDLISKKYGQEADQLGELFLKDQEEFSKQLDAMLDKDYSDDAAMCFYITIALLNSGEVEKAKKFIMPMYQKQPSNLLMGCAYAQVISFSNPANNISIAAVFGDTLDLDKATTERTLPLPLFLTFMEIAYGYYNEQENIRNYMLCLSYMLEVAPYHAVTQTVLSSLTNGFQDDEYDDENEDEDDQEETLSFQEVMKNFLENLQQKQ